MPKVDLKDCVKQIIAINKELDDHDSRQDGFVYFLEQLNTRIERLEKRAYAEHYGKIKWATIIGVMVLIAILTQHNQECEEVRVIKF